MKFHFPIQVCLIGLIGALLNACSPSYSKYIPAATELSPSAEPDYARLFYWAAHPDKKDPSDSVTQTLRKDYQQDQSVDVFFLHPTTLTDQEDVRWNADFEDAKLNAKTDYSSILYQASTFNEYRVFAPRYRQAHIRSYYTVDTASALQAFDKAYGDIRQAFRYYLNNYNQGRPIIIASHSQGSTHAIRLLKEFFDQQPLQQQLVAAWTIGMYIPMNYFTSIPLCQNASQTGCYCAWRTFKRNYIPENVQKESIPGSVTNPLTWTTQPDYAPYALNQGSVLQKFNKLYRQVADAQIEKSILWTSRLHFPGSFWFRTKNYHVGDINLFYLNIRTNLRQRVEQFKKKATS